MPRVDFYHLEVFALEQALPLLLSKALAAGNKVVVVAGSEERVEDLNVLLWTDRDAWLPHGSERDGRDRAADQPVWLTDRPDDNPNDATLLVLCDGMDSPLVDALPRTLDIFNGGSDAAVQAARTRYRRCMAAGHALHYWQQTPEGRWTEKASRPAVDRASDVGETPGEDDV